MIQHERRASVRAKRVLSIQYRLVKTERKNADTDWHLSTTEDMSLDGIGFYTDILYRPGDILEIKIVMSGILDIYNGPGKVTRVDRQRALNHYFVAVSTRSSKPSRKRNAKSYKSDHRKSTQKRSARRV